MPLRLRPSSGGRGHHLDGNGDDLATRATDAAIHVLGGLSQEFAQRAEAEEKAW